MLEALRVMEQDPENWAAQARDLGEMWRRISRQHLSSGQGCACGFGGGLMLQGAAFELDIVEFLIDEAREAGHADIVPFTEATAKRGADNYSLLALIEALSRPEAGEKLSSSSRAFAFERLRKTLGSMDEAHARGRFACD